MMNCMLAYVCLASFPSYHHWLLFTLKMRTLALSLTAPWSSIRYGKEVPGVDPSCREQFLNDEEFLEVFGMSKAEFAEQPKWRQMAAKKEKELF